MLEKSKKIIYRIYIEVFYYFYKMIYKFPKIHTIDETLDFIIENRVSLSRFGDGELHMVDNFGNIGFQNGNEKLSNRLKEVLLSKNKNCVVCLPYPLYSLDCYIQNSQYFWKASVVQHYKRYNQYLDFNKTYHNSFISRPYMDYIDKSNTGIYFEKFKNLWKDKDVLIVEGNLTKLGVGNDLFNNVNKIDRIVTLNKNVFDLYDKLYSSITDVIQDYDLVLLALGPTASVLTLDLADLKVQVVDIGHIDVEYMWYKNSNLEKVSIQGKFVNEAQNVDGNNKRSDLKGNELEYHNQIIKKILE